VIGDMRDRIRKYYVADPDFEPIGFRQADDSTVRAVAEAWRGLASEAGPFMHEALGGLPFGGQGAIDRVLTGILTAELAAHPERCQEPMAALEALQAALFDVYSQLDADLHITDPTALRTNVEAVLALLRDGCLAERSDDLIDVIAALGATTRDAVLAEMSAEDQALVAGKHVVDGVAALLADRRARMRDLAETLRADRGAEWGSIRYFSFEEAADDRTVPVLSHLGLLPDGLGEFFLRIFDAPTRDACAAILDAGDVPPYGADLSDEHHATCWRTHHVRALRDDPTQARRLAPAPTADAAAERRRLGVSEHQPLPIPPTIAERILY
jgi:hypothetical protein